MSIRPSNPGDADAPVIGIDLGTTNSCVAAVMDGVPAVFPNKGGSRTTPSVYAVATNGRVLVGAIAKRQAITNPAGTLQGVKRIIGRGWKTPEREKAQASVAYTLEEGAAGDVRIRVGGRSMAIPEVSSQVLLELKQVAEDALGRPVQKAVVTVPAYFTDSQRQATRDAGVLAGLEIIRIINEPTAAALAYSFGRTLDETVVVFDLGGGTFDVSILRVTESVVDVLATAGDTYLGGEDFDERIIDWLAFSFAQEHGVDLRQDRMALQRLRDAAERAKHDLSTAQQVEIHLPFIHSPEKGEAIHLQRTLTREKLESLVADLIDRTVAICTQALQDAELDPRKVDEVLLVGGQTRMPRVQARVAGLFGREPCRSVHPDEAVALGAAIQGAALTRRIDDVLLLDVTPMGLGISITGGYFHQLVPRNTTVPTRASHVFTTVQDNQTTARILVVQGESPVVSENALLGEFELTGLRRARRGEVEIEVDFDISADGIVSVQAKDLETGRAQQITVTSSYGLSEDELADLVARSSDDSIEARQEEQMDAWRKRARSHLAEIERLLPQVTEAVARSAFGEDALQKAAAVVSRARTAMEAGDGEALADSLGALERTRQLFDAVLASWRQQERA